MAKRQLKLDPLPLENEIADRISEIRRRHGATFPVARTQAFREFRITNLELYAPRISQVCGNRSAAKKRAQQGGGTESERQGPGVAALVLDRQGRNHLKSI